MLHILTMIFYKVLYMSIIGSIIGLIVFLMLKLFDKKISANCKCIILIVPILFLLIPMNRIEINANNNFNISNAVDKVEEVFSPEYILSKIENDDTTKDANYQEKVKQNKEAYMSSSGNNITSNLYNIIPFVWGIGFVMSIIMLVIGHILLILRIRKTQELNDEIANDILYECKRKLNIRKDIKLCLFNSSNCSPCIYGLIHPKILVPKDFKEKDTDVMKNVFMHELSHYKRKDMLTNFVLLLIKSMHWFNPLVHMLFKKTRQEMELATDEIALSKMNNEEKKRYGFTLIGLLQSYETEKLATKMLCMTDDSKNMERRIIKIKLSTKLRRYRKSIIILVVAFLIFIVSPFVVKSNASGDEVLYERVRQYLIKLEQEKHKIERTEFAVNGDDFNVFIDMAKVGIERSGDETYVYAWVLMESCYAQEELVTSGTSMAYKFTIKNEEIVNYEVPEDGDQYAKSMEEIFPDNIRKKMEQASQLVDEEKIRTQIQEHYSYIINEKNGNNMNNEYQSEDQYNLLGEWTPYMAEYNETEIPISAIYGSGISTYGGKLIFYEDGTYTEFMGVYAEEQMNDLQGHVQDNNGKTAILVTNNGEHKILKYLNTKDINSSNVDESTIVITSQDGNSVYFKR